MPRIFRILLLLCLCVICAMADSQGSADKGVKVTAASLVFRKAPVYTPEARLYGISGTVLLEVEIDESGATKVLRIVSPLGFGLDESAIEAVSQWRFKAARMDGKPVKVEFLIQVNYHRTRETVIPKREE